MRRIAAFSAVLFLGLAVTLVSRDPDARLKKAARSGERGGWIQVHLEGTPTEIGFQHGYLLSAEIQDNFKAISTEIAHEEKRDWAFFRKVAQETFWPHVEQEYRDEMNGIVEGLKARNVNLDVWDIVALNSWLELSYYDKWIDKKTGTTSNAAGPGDHCSAFVATGSYTRDGRVVIAHNNWTSYSSGERWNIIFDIQPANGNRIIMDGMPGLIHSGDDFGVNSAGIMITETTISGFTGGFDTNGIPEFVRARKAMQYSASIDDYARIMKEGNNGGYANNWLVADRKNNEVASLELGLKDVILQRTKDGFFVGSNFRREIHGMRDNPAFPGAQHHHVLAAVHCKFRDGNQPRDLQGPVKKCIRLFTRLLRPYVVRRLEINGVDFRELHELLNLHLSRRLWSNALQLVRLDGHKPAILIFVSLDHRARGYDLVSSLPH